MISLSINKLKEDYIKKGCDLDLYIFKIGLENHIHLKPFCDIKNILIN
jgi:hypothetical protein